MNPSRHPYRQRIALGLVCSLCCGKYYILFDDQERGRDRAAQGRERDALLLLLLLMFSMLRPSTRPSIHSIARRPPHHLLQHDDDDDDNNTTTERCHPKSFRRLRISSGAMVLYGCVGEGLHKIQINADRQGRIKDTSCRVIVICYNICGRYSGHWEIETAITLLY